MKIIHSLILLISFSFVLSSCSSSGKTRDWDEIKKSGVLRIAIDYDALGMFHNDVETKGIQYEMVKNMCEEFGIKAEFLVQGNIDKCIKGVQNGEYDLIARLIPVTTETKENIAFTNSICLDKQVLVQRKSAMCDNNVFVKNQLDLPGHCITVPKNSPYIQRLKNLAEEIGDSLSVEEIEHYQTEQIVILIANGDIDYTVCSYNQAERLSRAYPQIDYSTPISFSQMHGWALSNKSTVLLEKINEWLDKHSNDYFDK